MSALNLRVSWAATLIAAVLAVILSAVAYVTFAKMERDLVHATLLSEAEQSAVGQTAGMQLERYWFANGQPLTDLPAFAQVDTPGLHTKAGPDGNWFVFRLDRADGRMYVLHPAQVHERRVHDFGVALGLVGTLAVVLVFFLSHRVARVAVAPVRALAAQLERWAPAGSSQGGQRGLGDEARLRQAFSRLQGQVEELLIHEREYAARLGHELRTGLAAIRSDCELLQLQLPQGPVQQRLQRMKMQADQVCASLDRAESQGYSTRQPKQELLLREWVEQNWQSVSLLEPRSQQLAWINAVPPDVVRTLDVYALSMLLRILMRNAVDHAAPCQLRADWVGTSVLELADTGPGVAPEEQVLIFERHFSCGRQLPDDADGQTQRGKGLALARQIALAQGWSLTVQPGPDGTGCVFRLDLSPA
ncbi:sensor histidine kinase [Alcaligenes sp. SDU_A2]|uniref:sensor histidine kinase n=1 Tax=Alcaligenes sp. SDU_A2 TaxID=3136634 RepID=UPI00311E8064